MPRVGALDAEADLMETATPDPATARQLQKDIISLPRPHAVEPYPENLEIVPPRNLLNLFRRVANECFDDVGDVC